MEKKVWAGLSHLFVTVFMSCFAAFIVIPAITDVTISATCPAHQDQCSLAIYLTGIQQAVIGLGTVVMMPVIGNLSDVYGRKALLTLPLTLSIVPLVILAYSRETNFFFAYYVLRTLTAMVSEGSTNCLALAYVADVISEGKRASAFAILSGVTSTALVCGTLAARFISPALAFQVAAFVSMAAAVYMRVFLKESIEKGSGLTQPILKEGPDNMVQVDCDSPRHIPVFKKIPSVGDLVCLLKSSVTLSQVAVVAFFHSLAESGMISSLMYFLKARFQYDKNQYADLMLIMAVAGTLSQLILMPILVPAMGEERLLSIGLLVGSVNTIIYSISWSAWVPLAITVFSAFQLLVAPSLRSIASKQVGPNEQGKAQGCISGITSFASIVAPLIFSPLTAMFLSEGAPFYFPGFSILCIGFATIIAFIQSCMIRAAPTSSTKAAAIEDDVCDLEVASP
ncbi:hippocampus abundant transcript-like protein 1 [Tripterygium wilfordii]|uniref:Hippocampus abundant transcript-like protein 1 n=1 Tax=Tripterygium wilfordii TaxID=458696 RepID=A0A7J7DXJ7_TRIWF|nr:hippocampus abundant transcript 1 protein-like isoform X2 [Tripterygium wilfordii]KAF5751033.1 hippocampus abundant transcript-like protein 1 [Tripterygium wilfordii]